MLLVPFKVSVPRPLIVVAPLKTEAPPNVRLPPDRVKLASQVSVLPDCAPAVTSTVPAVEAI